MPTQPQFTPEQREEIKEIVHEALLEFFKSYGLSSKNMIVTAAIIIGSLTVVLGGVKTMLGWIGFSYIIK